MRDRQEIGRKSAEDRQKIARPALSPMFHETGARVPPGWGQGCGRARAIGLFATQSQTSCRLVLRLKQESRSTDAPAFLCVRPGHRRPVRKTRPGKRNQTSRTASRSQRAEHHRNHQGKRSSHGQSIDCGCPSHCHLRWITALRLPKRHQPATGFFMHRMLRRIILREQTGQQIVNILTTFMVD